MNLRATRHGYAYQDLITGIALVDLMLGTAETITVDTKGFTGDRFDDLTIAYRTGRRVRIQISTPAGTTSSRRTVSPQTGEASGSTCCSVLSFLTWTSTPVRCTGSSSEMAAPMTDSPQYSNSCTRPRSWQPSARRHHSQVQVRSAGPPGDRPLERTRRRSLRRAGADCVRAPHDRHQRPGIIARLHEPGSGRARAPASRLCCPVSSSGTTTPSDAHPARSHFPAHHASVTFTAEAAPGLHSAVIRANKAATASPR